MTMVMADYLWVIFCVPVAAIALHPLVVFVLLARYYHMTAWEMLGCMAKSAGNARPAILPMKKIKRKKAKRGKGRRKHKKNI